MSQPSDRRRLRHDRILQISSTALGLCGILLLWAGVLYTLETARRAVLVDARNETANLAHAFEEQIVRSIKSIDQSLLFIRENYARDPVAFDIERWTRNAAATADVAMQLSLIDRNGWTRSTSIEPNGKPINLNDREHIRVQLASPKDDLFISKPVIGRVSSRWSIQFTRKIFTQDGQLDGVIVLSVDPAYLSRFYGAIDLGKEGAVTLIGDDGVVRAAARANRPGEADLAIGKVIKPIEPSIALEPAEGVINQIDFDGVRRITSYRHIESYPLTVAVGIGALDRMARYRAMRDADLFIATMLTLMLAIASAGQLLFQRRHAIAREKLRESERLQAEKSSLLETALEHMNQGIMMIDGGRLLQVCNHRAAEMLDLPPELTNKGVPFDAIFAFQQQTDEFRPPSGELSQEARAVIGAGGITHMPANYERKRPNGTVLEVCSVPLKDGGVVRTYTDISVRKRNEEELRTARDEANSATRAKSEFLATMSHEIRSPLSGLVGAVDLLRNSHLNADQAHMAALAHVSATNLLAILNDILDFSKIEAGALTLSLEPVDLGLLVKEITAPHALVSAQRQVALTVSVAPGLPRYIRTDRLRLGQIINNLVSNAVKFTRSGTIEVCATDVLVDGAPQLRVDVRDTGFGMDEKTLARLFQPFTQADGSSSRQAEGTGLGLCISRRLAELLNGTLTVVSEPGRGSCFTLECPCIAAVKPSQSTPALGDEAGALATVFEGRVILVVDDNPTNQWLTRRQLTLMGATAEIAATGQAALEKLSTTRFDFVITDCHMPGMDGVALTKAIRQTDAPWSTVPVFGLTADVTAEQADRCRAVGMADLLYKPISRSRLAEAIGEHLPLEPAPAKQPEAAPQPAIFDKTLLDELFDGDDPEGVEWLRIYCRTTSSQVPALLALATAPTPSLSGVAAAAHQLVGASLSVGANRLAAAARALEHAANDRKDAATLATLARTVDREAKAAITAIAALTGDLAPADG